MPNVVEVIFKGDDSLTPVIEGINRQMPEIARGAQVAGSATDILEAKLRRLTTVAQLYGKEISAASYDALRARGIPAVEEATQKILRAGDAQRRLTQETKATAEASRQVEAAVARIRAQEARTAQIARTSSFTGERAPQFGSPEFAAATAVDRLRRGYDQAAVSQSRFTKGSAELRQSLISLSGVPYPEAVNQFLKLTGAGLVGGVAVAAVTALGAAVVTQLNKMREAAVGLLKEVDKSANVGLVGGFEKRERDIKQLRDILRTVEERRAFGEPVPTKEITDQLFKTIRVEGGLKPNDLVDELFGAVLLRGDQVSEVDLRLQLEKAEKVVNEFREKQRTRLRGDQQIIDFDRSRIDSDDLAGLAELERRQKRINEEKARYSVEELDLRKQIRAERDAEFQTFANQNRQQDTTGNKAQQQFRDAERVIAELRQQALVDNPFDIFYTRAATRQEEFSRQFQDLPNRYLTAFQQANENILSLDIFNKRLEIATNIADIRADVERLSLVGGRDRESQIGAQRAAFLSDRFDRELETRRLLGQGIDDTEALWRRVQLLQTNLSGRALAEAIEAATRGLTGAQLDAAGVRNARIGSLQQLQQFQDEDFFRQQRLRQIEEESRARQAQAALAALGIATTPEQRRAAIEAGLAATRDTGTLTPELIDARAKLLDISLQNQIEVLKRQEERDRQQQAAQQRFIAALEQFGEQLRLGSENFVAATKEPLQIAISTDSPAETSVDLGSVSSGNRLSNNY